MIDFVKYELTGIAPAQLEQNPLLEFHNKINTKTGELGTYINAYFKGTEFKIYDSTSKTPYRRITVEGSLHKYWNNGAHNFNDFGITEINQVLKELKQQFQIVPENCILRQLEVGVNINPTQRTKSILKQCLLHKTNRLKWVLTNKDEGHYIQAQHQRHILKMYDKKTHYKNRGFKISNEIMRIEIKYTKMHDLNKKGIYTLADLMQYGLINFRPVLLKHWENVIFYDYSTLKGRQEENHYSNPNYWENLSYEQFKYQRKKLKELTAKNPNNLKTKIANSIAEKCHSLNTQIPKINPLHIRLITGISGLENQDPNRRFCAITGLNISMQKESRMLSHTGLKYYYKTDRKIFDEVKRKYLSKLWQNADHKTQIREIAKNIRHTKTNRERKQERLYHPAQPTLFELELM